MTAHNTLSQLMGSVPTFESGHVWLTGAGPGDPGFLTLHAVAGLIQADVVVHDALVDSRVLALARPQAERIFAGKRGGKPSAVQADITARLIALARSGKRVLRLKGGDPYVFGRGGEEALALAASGIPYRVIPGVTSGLAGLAAASIPATMRGINRAIVLATGHEADLNAGLDWAAMARLGQPIVLYMAMRNLDHITRALMDGGLPGGTPAAVIIATATPQERILVSTLARICDDIHEAAFAPPAIVVIGEIVAMRAQLKQLATQAEKEML